MADEHYTGSNALSRVVVDECDAAILDGFNWSITRKGYVSRMVRVDGSWQRIYLHRLISCAKADDVVDHINGNTLDNRRSNLRLCSHAENMRNRKIGKNNSSGYKGVSFCANKKKQWRAQIRVDGRKISVGSFYSPEDAHRAYTEAALKYHGEFARLC